MASKWSSSLCNVSILSRNDGGMWKGKQQGNELWQKIWIVGTRDYINWYLKVTAMSFLFIENSKMASSIWQLTNNRHREGITSQKMGMFCAALSPVPKNKTTVLTSVNQWLIVFFYNCSVFHLCSLNKQIYKQWIWY